MAHFSNGTEGQMYEEKWCFRCQHGRHCEDDDECKVWEAHFDFCQELCNETEAPGRHILDMLIPVDEDHWPQKCSMFIEYLGRDKVRVAELKARADQLIHNGKVTDALKVFNLAWDMERTM